MKAGALVAGVAAYLFSCVPPKPPVIMPVAPTEPHACFPDPQPPAERICVGIFTEDGHACAACDNAGGCVSVSVEVYCAAGGSCGSDPACHTESGKPLVEAKR
jgi:hypothetical protein